jgi:hypothetical protein
MPTPDFLALKTRLTHLKMMLPDVTIASANLSMRQIDEISAYVLLTHAACEEFMEKRSLQTATAAMTAFDTSGTIGRVGKHLCVFPFIDVPNDKADLRKLSSIVGVSGFGVSMSKGFKAANSLQIQKLLNIGYQRFKSAVEGNHGASMKYQFKLLSRIGLDINDLGANFISRIAQLAEARGEAAHKPVVAATMLYEPATLATWPTDLLDGYKLMDIRLSGLERKP